MGHEQNNCNPFGHITEHLEQEMEDSSLVQFKGKVIQVVGTIITVSLPGVKIGELCVLRIPWEEAELMAEVVGFSQQATILTPIGDIQTRKVHMVPVGDNLRERVIDG
jgi:type III secretion protein N (ATPase)